MSTIDLVASVVASRLGPILAKVDPGGLWYQWFSKRGLKRAVVVLVVRAFDNDCVCAHLAHEFSIDFICKHMSSRVYQK